MTAIVRRVGSLVLVGLVISVVQACGDARKEAVVAPPVETTVASAPATSATTVATTVTTTSTTVDPTRARVIAAYDGMWKNYFRAGNPPQPEAPYLPEYATGDMLAGTRDDLTTKRASGLAIRGSYEIGAVVTRLTASTAVIEDCGLDRSEEFRIATGVVTKGSDANRDGRVVDLVVEGGRWKVSFIRNDQGVCNR